MTDLWSYSRTNGYKLGNASRKNKNLEVHREQGKKSKIFRNSIQPFMDFIKSLQDFKRGRKICCLKRDWHSDLDPVPNTNISTCGLSYTQSLGHS